jgi:hypothetical protein
MTKSSPKSTAAQATPTTDDILTNLLPEMSKEILSRMAAGEQIKEVTVIAEGVVSF